MEVQRIATILTLALFVPVLAGCVGPAGDAEIFGTATGGTLESGVITQVGSSTVLPLAEVWAQEFGTARGIQIVVKGGGSGAGASDLCHGRADLGDMSRLMKASEIEGPCADNGVDPRAWSIAFDGLSVVVDMDNTFVEDLSVEQLALIFKKEGFASKWNQVDPTFPNQDIELCYPGSDSGTYEYFNEAILDKGDPRTGNGVETSEEDNVLVRCIETNPYAIGYFGYAYVRSNAGKVKAVSVDGVVPTFESIRDGTYTPLGRPIYIYTDGVPAGILADYFRYVLHPEGGQARIERVGYVPLDEATRLDMLAKLG